MEKTSPKKRKRINITLPEDTIRLIDRVADKGERSYVIDRAVHFYVETGGKRNLREQLKEGAIARVDQDRQLAEEWFDLENEVWK